MYVFTTGLSDKTRKEDLEQLEQLEQQTAKIRKAGSFMQ
jgi:hypothetical protein